MKEKWRRPIGLTKGRVHYRHRERGGERRNRGEKCHLRVERKKGEGVHNQKRSPFNKKKNKENVARRKKQQGMGKGPTVCG